MKIDHPHQMFLSDFEKKMVLDFRKTLDEGYGNLTIKVHDHKLVAYEPMVNPGVRQFQETQLDPMQKQNREFLRKNGFEVI